MLLGVKGSFRSDTQRTFVPRELRTPLDSSSEPTWRQTVLQNFAENNKDDGDKEEAEERERENSSFLALHNRPEGSAEGLTFRNVLKRDAKYNQMYELDLV